jgi:hypothetical protein
VIIQENSLQRDLKEIAPGNMSSLVRVDMRRKPLEAFLRPKITKIIVGVYRHVTEEIAIACQIIQRSGVMIGPKAEILVRKRTNN